MRVDQLGQRQRRAGERDVAAAVGIDPAAALELLVHARRERPAVAALVAQEDLGLEAVHALEHRVEKALDLALDLGVARTVGDLELDRAAIARDPQGAKERRHEGRLLLDVGRQLGFDPTGQVDDCEHAGRLLTQSGTRHGRECAGPAQNW